MDPAMNTNEIIEMFDKYVIANYGRLPKAIVKGTGNYIFDADGNKILDMFPGWAVSGIGHCHPKVTEAIRAQAGELLHIDNTFYIPKQGKLAKLLSERAFGGKSFFCNSGAEASEAAMKLARIHTPPQPSRNITMASCPCCRAFNMCPSTISMRSPQPLTMKSQPSSWSPSRAKAALTSQPMNTCRLSASFATNTAPL